MRLHIVWTIFRKEVTEVLRDRLTLLVALGVPLIVYPIMMISFGTLHTSQEKRQESRASQVAVWGGATDELQTALGRTNSLKAHVWKDAPDGVRVALQTATTNDSPASLDSLRSNVVAAARGAVSQGTVDAVVVLWPGFQEAMEKGGLSEMSIYFDSVRPGSLMASDRLGDELGAFRREVVKKREIERNLPEGFSRAIRINTENVASRARQSGQVVGMAFPLLIVLLAMTASVFAAADLTAGEKERGTMQTLLCAPLRSSEVVTGKFLTVWAVCLVAALINTVSLGATVGRAASFGDEVTLPLSKYVLMFFTLLPVTFTLAAVLLAVGALAKDVKEAGNLGSVTVLLLTMPMGVSLAPGMELNATTALIPLVNLSLLIKALFISNAQPGPAMVAFAASAAYAVLAIMFAARVFARERVMLGGKASLRDVFAVERSEGVTPTPAFTIATCAVLLLVVFYGSTFVRQNDVFAMVLLLQYGLLLLPVLVLARAMKFSFHETFSLRVPNLRTFVGAVIIGLSAWTVAAASTRVLPPPEGLAKELLETIIPPNAPLWLVLFVVAVTPAICEELVFRGLIFSGLRSLGKWPAILLSAFLFSLPHASVYRLLPTFFLGIVLGLIVWRTGSILCSIIVHAINNGLIALVAFYALKSTQPTAATMDFLPWSISIAGAVVVGLGVWLLQPATKTKVDLAPTVDH